MKTTVETYPDFYSLDSNFPVQNVLTVYAAP